MICNNCGALLNENSKFCSGCGAAAVGSAASGDQSSYASSPPPSTSVTSLFSDAPQPGPAIACILHTSEVAAGACVGCGNFYCRGCLASSQGRNYCEPCLTRLNTAPRPAAQPYQQQQPPAPYYPQPPQAYQHPQAYQQQQYSYPPAPPSYQQGYLQPISPYVKRKEPGVALLLSLLLPGLGQFYNGDVGKGIAFLLAFVILVWIFIGWIFWIIAMVDAYQSANSINMGRRV